MIFQVIFVFGDFNDHHKDWLTYTGGTERSGELCYKWPYSSQMTLLRWLTFLLGSQTVIFQVMLFWIYFFLLMLVFVLQWLSLHCEILIMFLSQFSLTFHHIQNGMAHVMALLMTILVVIGTTFVIIWEMFHGRISLNSILLLLLVNFVSSGCNWCLYPTQKVPVKAHSSPWFSGACADAIIHRNNFFHLYQKDKSSESKVKFRQLVIVAKGFLKLQNLHVLIQQNSPSLPRNLALGTLANCQ